MLPKKCLNHGGALPQYRLNHQILGLESWGEWVVSVVRTNQDDCIQAITTGA